MPTTYRQAADDLTKALNAAETRAKLAYGKQRMTKLYDRFEKARAALR